MSKLRVNEIEPFSSAGIAIGGTPFQPSAILDLQSTTQGFLPPRMTTVQRNAIATPVDGLVIFNTDTHAIEHYSSGTSSWESTDGVQAINGQKAKLQIINFGSAGLFPNMTQTGTDTNTINLPLSKNSGVTSGMLSNQDYVLFGESATMGVMEGGEIDTPSGLTVTLHDGFGYLEVEPEIYLRFDWPTQTVTLPANQSSYLYYDSAGALNINPVAPVTFYNILIGRVVTDGTSVVLIDEAPLFAEHTSNSFDLFHRHALGAVFSFGSQVSENGTRQLDVSSGEYFLSTNVFNPSGGTAISWQAFHEDGVGGFLHSNQSTVDNAFYDNGTGTLAALTAGYYAKHSLYIVGQGSNERYLLVYSQAQYSALTLAEQGALPTPPPYFTEGVVPVASIIVQQGTTNIIEIRDERPRIGFSQSGLVAASTFHSNLLGLTTGDDHPQYWRNDGTHVATGNFNMGTHNITNAGTYNGVTVEAHASRHLPAGADPLTTGTPSTIGPDNLNNIGVANSFARADHVHSVPTAVVSSLIPDQTNARGSSSSFARADHIHNVATGVPVTIGTSNAQGTASTFAKSDHVHNHGAQSDPTQHAVATSLANGFMSSTDKAKLDTIGANANVTSVNTKTGVVVLTTTDIAEGTNLYYTQARFDSAFAAKTTTSLAEGTNLYYTQDRFDSAFAAKTTDNLSEGSTNLYFATSRARASVSATSPIQYSSVSGAISILQAGTAQNGYLSSTDWNTFNNKQTAGNYITALTGDVTASGPGSVAATVASVGGSSAANVHAAELLANAATNLDTASAIAKRSSSGTINVTAINEAFTSTVSSATAIVLTVSSSAQQEITGSTAQTIKLPDATTLTLGRRFYFFNQSSADISLQDNGGNAIVTIPPGFQAVAVASSISTTNGTWDTSNRIGLTVTDKTPTTVTPVGSMDFGPDFAVTAGASGHANIALKQKVASTDSNPAQVINSATFVDVTSATQTVPTSGDYLVIYDGNFTPSNTGRTIDIIIVSNGVALSNTQRSDGSGSAGAPVNLGSHTVIIGLTAGQIVKIQARISSNTVTVSQQSLTILKIG